MTLRTDQHGNLRGPDPSGKGGVKRDEARGSRARHAAQARKDRRARVLLTRNPEAVA